MQTDRKANYDTRKDSKLHKSKELKESKQREYVKQQNVSFTVVSKDDINSLSEENERDSNF